MSDTEGGGREQPTSVHWQYKSKDMLRVCDGCGVVFDAFNHDCPICSHDTDSDQ